MDVYTDGINEADHSWPPLDSFEIQRQKKKMKTKKKKIKEKKEKKKARPPILMPEYDDDDGWCVALRFEEKIAHT